MPQIYIQTNKHTESHMEVAPPPKNMGRGKAEDIEERRKKVGVNNGQLRFRPPLRSSQTAEQISNILLNAER